MPDMTDGLDQVIVEFDRALRTLAGAARAARATPGGSLGEADLAQADRRHAAALMRVNHTGEVCAQALYSGQALTARNSQTRTVLQQAAAEETDHLAWTAERVESLGGRLSILNPGFRAETERQVEAHLDGHLDSLPVADLKSREVVETMKRDEARHASTASVHGAAELPGPVKTVMRLAARAMTFSTYRV
jgi:ubiquinone biosynthesis monooxygenase Coq7